MSSLALSRVIIFTADIAGMTRFYRDVIGLPVLGEEKGWVELGAGGCSIALHAWRGKAPEGPVKIVFHSDDVAAARAELVGRGATLGKVSSFGSIDLCDGFDPDGNAYQISSRVTAGR
jgi:catechol-2,3-dioxygenase